jgi:aromatic ring-opening dioxygenase catalytic subunit (LigB family)
MILADSRKSYLNCNTLLLAILHWLVESKNCSRLWRSSSTTHGASTMGHGQCFGTCIPMLVFPSSNSVLMKQKPASFHFEVGEKLAPLREDGILIIGSGNLVHNLHAYAWGRHMPDPYDWAVRFEREAKETMIAGEYKPLIEYETLGPEALLSIPTPDHYLPMLYVLATRQKGEVMSFPIEGVDGGSISMLTVQVGGLSVPISKAR